MTRKRPTRRELAEEGVTCGKPKPKPTPTFAPPPGPPPPPPGPPQNDEPIG